MQSLKNQENSLKNGQIEQGLLAVKQHYFIFSGTLSLSSWSWLFCCSVLVWTARRKRVTIWYAIATLNKLRRGHSKFVWLRSNVLLGKHRTNIEKGKTFSWRRDHPQQKVHHLKLLSKYNLCIICGARYSTEMKILCSFVQTEDACSSILIHFEANVEGQMQQNLKHLFYYFTEKPFQTDLYK